MVPLDISRLGGNTRGDQAPRRGYDLGKLQRNQGGCCRTAPNVWQCRLWRYIGSTSAAARRRRAGGVATTLDPRGQAVRLPAQACLRAALCPLLRRGRGRVRRNRPDYGRFSSPSRHLSDPRRAAASGRERGGLRRTGAGAARGFCQRLPRNLSRPGPVSRSRSAAIGDQRTGHRPPAARERLRRGGADEPAAISDPQPDYFGPGNIRLLTHCHPVLRPIDGRSTAAGRVDGSLQGYRGAIGDYRADGLAVAALRVFPPRAGRVAALLRLCPQRPDRCGSCRRYLPLIPSARS
jgi:hypothetical protein